MALSPAIAPPVLEVANLGGSQLRWLVRMRWWAMAVLVSGAALGVFGWLPGLGWNVWVAAAATGVLFNVVVARRLDAPDGEPRPGWNLVAQVVFDFALLTIVLFAAGKTPAPLLGFYVFHVVLLGTFHGRRAALFGAAVAVTCVIVLATARTVPSIQVGAWHPLTPAVGTGVELAATVAFLGGVAVVVSHAVRELRERERALATARAQVELDYQLLTNTLDELQAGLEVRDDGGRVLWRNRLAEHLAASADPADGACGHPCHVDGKCPVDLARQDGAAGRCRFAASLDGDERVFEMLSFPLSPGGDGGRRVMNLYVDRTQATLAERSLVQAERLVGLGRVAQSVAHELNTPLSTLQTLAADLRAAVVELGAGDGLVRSSTKADLVESAEAIHAASRRLGRITQALLVGSDIVQGQARRSATVGALVERARAIVTAAGSSGSAVEIRGDPGAMTLDGDAESFVQIVVNLLQNAVDASRSRRPATPVVACLVPQPDGSLELWVDDEGPGIDPRVAQRLFEPFATTKTPGEGTGLGLYASRKLVEELGGDLEIGPRPPGPGTRAKVRLPVEILSSVAPSSSLSQRASS